jgi:hypothetical protein
MAFWTSARVLSWSSFSSKPFLHCTSTTEVGRLTHQKQRGIDEQGVSSSPDPKRSERRKMPLAQTLSSPAPYASAQSLGGYQSPDSVK